MAPNIKLINRFEEDKVNKMIGSVLEMPSSGEKVYYFKEKISITPPKKCLWTEKVILYS